MDNTIYRHQYNSAKLMYKIEPTKLFQNISKGNKKAKWKQILKYTTVKGPGSVAKNKIGWTNSFYTKPIKQKIFYTHDNRGRPFKVIIDKKKIDVYLGYYDFKKKKYFYKLKVLTIEDYHGYWIGRHHEKDLTKKFSEGNSILVKIGNKDYISIGVEIFRFKTPDEIYEYVSPIGNNDVPYPFAIGTKNFYFIVGREYVPLKDIKIEINTKTLKNFDLVSYYFGHIDEDGAPIKNKQKNTKTFDRSKIKKLKVKMIVPRIFL